MRATLRFLGDPGRQRRRGQSLVELAIVTPLLGLLLMGGFDASIMVSDKVTSGSAVRQGARLAAELGGSQTNPGATTRAIDLQIVHNILAMSGGMTSATIQEIDIYAPTTLDGNYQPGVDLVNQYFVDPRGGVTVGIQTFPINQRKQTPPNETSIGIRLVWTYSAPAGIFPRNVNMSDYSVMKAAPVLG
jgi:Flp pilus assembly protein TadG